MQKYFFIKYKVIREMFVKKNRNFDLDQVTKIINKKQKEQKNRKKG